MLPAAAAMAVALVSAGAAAEAPTVVIGGPGGIRVQARVRARPGRAAPGLGVAARSASPAPSRPPARSRGGSTPQPAPEPPPPRAPAPAEVAADADRACLASLRDWDIPFVTVAPTQGIRTPIRITGPIRGLRLIARGKPALMDCQLGHALARAAPVMLEVGVTGLSFSGTYQYRNVRGTQRLSGHAHGLAIDVHALRDAAGAAGRRARLPEGAGPLGRRPAVPGVTSTPASATRPPPADACCARWPAGCAATRCSRW